ncbi:MAG: PleD family two-component system response regulator [Bdellovibrionales bacterium]
MAGHAKSILIVDDMKTVRLKLKKICEEIGIQQIFEASDGQQALEVLQGMKIDLVVSDWNMPNMTGLELVEKMRGSSKTIDTPVIFVTSENEKSAILKSLMNGVTDYVVKPFPDTIIKQKICTVLKIQPRA